MQAFASRPSPRQFRVRTNFSRSFIDRGYAGLFAVFAIKHQSPVARVYRLRKGPR